MAETVQERIQAIDEFIRESVDPTVSVDQAVAVSTEPDGTLILRIRGSSLNSSDVEAVQTAVSRVLESSPSRKISLDFHNVKMISSAGWGWLLNLARKLKTEGATLIVRNVNPDVMRYAHMIHFDKILEFRVAPESHADTK